jgi:hypothetical protein
MMQHYHEKIQGWFQCEPLYCRMVEQAKDGSVFVEVGVWKGKSSAFMGVEIINSKKKIEFYAVDHFQGSPEHQDEPEIKSMTLKEECYKNLEPVMGIVRMLPLPSLKAAAMFTDNSIDFVYIDGSHEYDDLKADILAWGPKVKNGGIIAGDDYGIGEHPDVKTVVDEIFPSAVKKGVVWIYEK